jgi:hypothetical protein
MTVAYQPQPTSYRPVVEQLFQVARSAREGLVDPRACEPEYLECVDARDLSADDLIVAAETAMFEGKWAIFAFRGIGSGEEAVNAEAHRRLCEWAGEHRETVRTGPVLSLAMELKEKLAAYSGAYSWSLSESNSDAPS